LPNRAGEELRISATDNRLDLRVYALGAGPARVMMPTGKGVTIPLTTLSELIAALVGAETEARERGLIGGAL
jgi:hypothetical protein